MVWQILFIICLILTKWKNVREPPAMIRRSKARIPELAMQRQSPMDTRVEESNKH
jgi:hypothetical protein